MFSTDNEIEFAFDQWRRLRITMLPDYLPLAAWLHTDVQPNLFAVDKFLDLLNQAERNGEPVHGNGCRVQFRPDGSVELVSLYDRWPPLLVPSELFWPVLGALRSFLAETLDGADLSRPADYPAVSRQATLREDPAGRAALVDHTYFPREWSEQDVRAAGAGAWNSPEALYDEQTGAWSGLWHGLELAGYFDPAAGTVQTYFPVLAP